MVVLKVMQIIKSSLQSSLQVQFSEKGSNFFFCICKVIMCYISVKGLKDPTKALEGEIHSVHHSPLAQSFFIFHFTDRPDPIF